MSPYTLTDAQFATFSAILLAGTGLHFDPSKRATLQSHLRARALACQTPDFGAYLHLLQAPAHGRAELHRLIEHVVVHETSFFRNKEHFTALNTIALPSLVGQPRDGARARTLRIWSAGCATGEEPYSLAITCLEHPALAGWKIEIIASDVSERVLEIARQGIYSADALRYVTPERIARWFTPVNEKPPAPRGTPGAGKAPPAAPASPTERQGKVRYRIADPVRQLVTFRRHNLADFPFDRQAVGDLDLLLCENVLIYFNPQVVRQVADEFYHCLCPGGYLFLGYSETLWRVSTAYALVTTPGTFFYQRPLAGAAAPANGPVAPAARSPVPRPAPSPSESPGPPRRFTATPPPQARPAAAAPPVTPPALPTNVGAAVARDPAGVATAQAQTRKGREWLELGRYAEARAAFESALRHYPAAVDALVGLAQIHANQGEPERAIAECRRALDLDALCEEAHLLLGLLYRLQGPAAVAIDHFSKAIYINFESVPAHFHLAELYRTQGAPADAAREYRRTLWALDQHPAQEPIGGMPPAMLRQVCEKQIRRLEGSGKRET